MPPNISLKQRLAALSIAPSSPTSPYGSDAPPKSPSRRKFNAPWARRNANENLEVDSGARDRVQDVMNKLIFQAGVDYECVCLYIARMFADTLLQDATYVS